MSDQAILNERLRGATLRELAEANEMTPEGIRLAIGRHGRRVIDRIELDLLAEVPYTPGSAPFLPYPLAPSACAERQVCSHFPHSSPDGTSACHAEGRGLESISRLREARSWSGFFVF